MRKFFVDTEPSGKVILGQEEARHIGKVLRMGKGDEIVLCDGKATDYFCRIEEITKTEVVCEVFDKKESVSEPPCFVTLYQAVPKGEKFEYIIQKCTELGMSAIVPVQTERVQGEPNIRMERLAKISMSAAQQSGRGIIPSVSEKISFDEALCKMTKADIAIVPYEDESACMLKDVLRGKEPKSISLLIGPEGGFSPSEIEKAKKAGVLPVSLGRRILRTETAGAATIASIMYEYERV